MNVTHTPEATNAVHAMADAAVPPSFARICDEAPPHGVLRVAWVVMAFVSLLIGWSMLGRLDIVVVADGQLVPETRVKIVQPAEGGVVREVRVREGQSVQAGQVLLQLDGTLHHAEAARMRDALVRHRLSLRRLDAEQAGRPLSSLPGDDPSLYAELQARWRANVALQAASERAALAERDRAAEELASAREELAKIVTLLPAVERERAAYDRLRAQHHVSEIEYAGHERQWLALDKDRDVQQARVQALDAAVRHADQQWQALRAGQRARLAEEHALLEAEIVRLERALAAQQHREAALWLRAPRNGTVQALHAHTAGTVVAPGSVLLTLVPDDDALRAEVFVRNPDVARLRPGLPVQLKVHAFPFQRHGMLDGVLESLSPDALASGDGSTPDDAAPAPGRYRARVRISPTPAARIDIAELAAGMWVSAEIKAGSRRPVDYLLDPVRRVVSTAAREP